MVTVNHFSFHHPIQDCAVCLRPLFGISCLLPRKLCVTTDIAPSSSSAAHSITPLLEIVVCPSIKLIPEKGSHYVFLLLSSKRNSINPDFESFMYI